MSGFLRGHSCCSAPIRLTDDRRVSQNNRKEVWVIPTLSGVFASICLLLANLKAYGLSESSIQLVRSYLSEYKQHVQCSSIYSDWLQFDAEYHKGVSWVPYVFL